MIEQNVTAILERLKEGNARKEPVTLVAATKTRTPEEINRAIRAGVKDIGENRVQEFLEKSDSILSCRRHFIGRLQTNKIKYLLGKTCLIHSLDRDPLAEALDSLSLRAGLLTDVLLEVNLGESSKGGYPLPEAFRAFCRLREKKGLRIRGFMAMLPHSDDRPLLEDLADRMRALFDEAAGKSEDIAYLSMGMSSDWELCLQHGANMIRLGSALFGERA